MDCSSSSLFIRFFFSLKIYLITINWMECVSLLEINVSLSRIRADASLFIVLLSWVKTDVCLNGHFIFPISFFYAYNVCLSLWVLLCYTFFIYNSRSQAFPFIKWLLFHHLLIETYCKHMKKTFQCQKNTYHKKKETKNLAQCQSFHNKKYIVSG